MSRPSDWTTARNFGRDARLCLLAVAMFGFAHMGMYGVLLNLYALRQGFGLPFIGLLNGAALLAFAFASLPAAAAGMRWGSRRASLAGSAIIVVAGAMLPIEHTTIEAQGAWLAGHYALLLCGIALCTVTSLPLLMAVTDDVERRRVLAAAALVRALAASAGSLIGGLLPGLLAAMLQAPQDQPALYRAALWCAEGCFVTGSLALLAIREHHWAGDAVPGVPAAADDRGTELPGRLRRVYMGRAVVPLGMIAAIGLISMLRVAGDAGVGVFFNVYLDVTLRAPASLIGALVALGQLSALLAYRAAPRLVARFGLRHVFTAGVTAAALSLLPLALIPTQPAAGISLLGIAIAGAIANNAAGLFHQELAPARWRALMSGTAVTAAGLGTAAVAVAGGALMSALGYGVFMLGMGALSVAGGVVFWAYFRRPRVMLAHARRD